MAPDLPLEIWMNIASYLPLGYIRRLLTVNRHLFHLAMEDRYETFRATPSADSRVLERIRYTHAFSGLGHMVLTHYGRSPIGPQYIRRLEVQSISSCPFPRLKGIGLFLPTPGPRTVKPTRIIKTLTDALPRCARLEEVTLDVYGLECKRAFSGSEWKIAFYDFLSTLLSQKGGSICKLNIEGDLQGFCRFFAFFSLRSFSLPHLESLTLKPPKSFLTPKQRVPELLNGAVAFIAAHKHSLRALALHPTPQTSLFDTSVLIDMGCLPRLRKLELSIPAVQILRLKHLEKFLLLNAISLECFILGFTVFYSDPLLSEPKLLSKIYQNLLDNIFPNLHFPVLSEFSIQVPDDTAVSFHLPQFDSFAPNIKRLDINLLTDDREFTSLLQNLVDSRVDLRSFRFKVISLSPENLDQLALQLPLLESLVIMYGRLVDGPYESFDTQIYSRKYTSWSLKYVRLAKISHCPDGHPSAGTNIAVARSIPGLQVADYSRRCGCLR